MSVDVGSAVGYLDLDINGFMAGLKTAQSEAAAATGNIATKLGGGLQSVGKSLTTAGSTLTKGLTVPIVGIGAAMVKTTATFESQMSKVSAISGATGKDYETLKAKAMEMGSKTKFSATEAGQAMEYMGMAGWDTGQMVDGLAGIMNLAAASGEDLGTTSDIVTDALTAFGLQASDASRFADILAKTSTKSNTNVSMLGESFKYVAPLCGTLGYSAEDCATALGTMANAGIKGSQAGTTLKTALANMASPTDNMAAKMEELGISITNQDGSMKTLKEVLDNVRTSMSGLSADQQAAAASTIFGKEAMSGMLAIVNTSQSDYDALTDSINKCDGTAESMANTMNDNLNGQLTILKSTLETVCLQFGDIMLPVLKKVVTKVQELSTWLTTLNDSQRETIIKIASILAVLGPSLLIVGKLTTSIGGFVSACGKIGGALSGITSAASTAGGAASAAGVAGAAGFTAMLGPILIIVAAIAALVAIFATLWKNNEQFRDKITSIWEEIKDSTSSFVKGVSDRLSGLKEAFTNIINFIKPIWIAFCNWIAPLFTGAFQIISSLLSATFNIILGILDVFTGIFTGNWSLAWEGVKEIFSSLWNAIVSVFKNISTIISTLLGSLVMAIAGFIGKILSAIGSWASSMIAKAVEAGSGFLNGIISFFVQLPGKVLNFISSVLSNVSTWVVNMANKAKEAGSKFLSNVVSFMQNLPYNVGYLIGLALGHVIKWTTDMISKAKEMGTNFLNNVVLFFTQLPGRILTFVTNAYTNVVTWVTNMVNKAKEMGTQFLSNVVTFFTQLPGKVLEFITSTFNNVVTWTTNMGAKALEAGQTFLNNVINTITNLPGNVQKFLTDTINNLATWVVDMGAKGLEAINSLINSVIEGAAQIPSQMMAIGKNIVDGVWSGIVAAKNTFVSNITGFFKGIVDGVKSTLGIHSPSRVFKDQIGVNMAKGVIKGLEEEYGPLKKAGKESMAKVFEGAKEAADANSSMSNKALVSYWKKMLSTFKKGSKEYKKAQKEYNKAVKAATEDLNDTILSDAEDALSKKKDLEDMSVKQEKDYWADVLAKMDKGTDAYKDAYHKWQIANKNTLDEIAVQQKDFNNKISDLQDDLLTNVKSAVEKYDSELASTKDSIKSSLSLFDEFSSTTENTKDSLVTNLESQVKALDDYESTLSSLKGKNIIPKDMLTELEEMGIDSLADLKQINEMTDDELTSYVDLWKKKEEKAGSIAKSQLVDTGYYQECLDEIKKYVSEAGSSINELISEYTKSLADLGGTLGTTSTSIVANLVAGLVKGLGTDGSDFQDTIYDLFKNSTDDVKKLLGIHSPSKEYESIGENMIAGASNGIENVGSQLLESMANLLDSIKAMWVNFNQWLQADSGIGSVFNDMIEKLKEMQAISKDVMSMFGNVNNAYAIIAYKFNKDFDPKDFGGGGDKPKGETTNIYTFYSQAKLSEVECRHEMIQAQKELALDL